MNSDAGDVNELGNALLFGTKKGQSAILGRGRRI